MKPDTNDDRSMNTPRTAPPPLPANAAGPEPGQPHLTGWGKAKRFLQILNVRLRFIFLMVVVGVVAGKWETIVNSYDRLSLPWLPWARPASADDMVRDENVEFYCPMHPTVHQDTPGQCPICGMPLSKRVKSNGPTSRPEGVLAQVQLTRQKIELGRIDTSPIEYRLMGREVRTIGQIDYDETRRTVITSRIKGRLDKLWINFTGQKVNAGDKLAEIYSPGLLVAQEELLLAAKSAKGPDDPNNLAWQSARSMFEAARKKLTLWGITDQQIDEIIKRGKPVDTLVIYSPMTGIVTEKKVLEGQYVMDGQELYTVADLGRVWMQANIYEQDIGGIRQGRSVAVEAEAYPNQSFPGNITFIAFRVDPETRTIKARIEINNPEYKLKPGMNVVARIGVPIGADPVETTPASQPETTSVDTHGLTHAYLAVSAALAADKADVAAAQKLATEAEALIGHVGSLGSPAANLKAVAEQARQMAATHDLTSQRNLFRTMSEQIVTLLRAHPPAGMPLYVANCPMAGTGGNWLSAKNEVINPYQGSGMLTCGSITGELKSEAAPGATGFQPVLPAASTTQPGPAAGVRYSPDGRFAYGYYCPVHPDRLYDKPEECPLDNFLFKYMKVERVLAVPESAVIDTGERQVVFRERSAGSFDMVEVTLGPRAGEFYQVLSGLKRGDRVVSHGAFLVDAENRLQPAAAAQYTGGSGSPKAEPAHGGHVH